MAIPFEELMRLLENPEANGVEFVPIPGTGFEVDGELPPAEAWSLEKYLSQVRVLPRPTAEQRQNFVRFVAQAHSWYKHLPCYLPGAPFYFFLDPYVGCDLLYDEAEQLRVVPRVVHGGHYSHLATADYRARFGFLGYSNSRTVARPLGQLRHYEVMYRQPPPAEDFPLGEAYALPEEIAAAGGVNCTAAIHPLGASLSWWERMAAHEEELVWPAESGGQAQLERIFARCRELEQDYKNYKSIAFDDPLYQKEDGYWGADEVLAELLKPELQRQQQAMRNAIDAVCQIVFAA